MRELQERLKKLEEPLGALAVRLPSREGRELASAFLVALRKVLNRDGWLLRMIERNEDFVESRNEAVGEWEKTYNLARNLREAMHESDERAEGSDLKAEGGTICE